MSTRSSLVLALASVALGGCIVEASVEPQIPAPEWQTGEAEAAWHKVEAVDGYVVARGPGARTELKVTKDAITSHDVKLERDAQDPKTFHGIAWGSGSHTSSVIEMTVEGSRVHGFRNAQPIEITLVREGSDTKVEGNYGGGFVHFKMRSDDGATCAYRDDSAPDDEPLTCQSLRSSFVLPKVMTELPEGERAAMLLVAFYQ